MNQIERVMIVGAGWVGRQVAALLAKHSMAVGLVDRSEELSRQAAQWVQCFLRDEARHADHNTGGSQALHHANLRPLQSAIDSGLAPAESKVEALAGLTEMTAQQIDLWQPDLILECVSEQLSLKKRVLKLLGEITADRCILASNSSYFVPSVLAQFVRRPQRFAHLHFHVPVLQESVVDIVGCEHTAVETLSALEAWVRRLGHQPLMLRREHPGYVFNWLLQALLKAALELAAQDVVDPIDIDRSWKAVTGMYLGPFGMMDQIGLDVIEQVLANARWAAPSKLDDQRLLELIRPLIAEGKLGMKSGAGFYDYS